MVIGRTEETDANEGIFVAEFVYDNENIHVRNRRAIIDQGFDSIQHPMM